ncbi:MAG: ABC transporter ATP-binding protein [Rhodobacteraceae bacterium]|nr:ABC transporter ATP-binding protein [Paracoccaceae bacterium]
MTLLSVERLTVRRRGATVLEGVSLTVGPGEVVGLIGPNGAGKTTLMRAALGLIPAEGRASLAALPARARARAAAFLPQGREIAWPVAVEVLVALGRAPHRATAGGLSEADRAAVARAMARMEVAHLAGRPATELSGGEAARVLIARVLAQETPLILADEPTAGLDPAAQIATMEVFGDLAREGRGILVALHDLALAARHCTRLVALSGGRVAAAGPPAEVLSPDSAAALFGIEARWEEGPDGPLFHALGRRRG